MITPEERIIIDRMKELEDLYSLRDFYYDLFKDGKLYKNLVDEFIDFLLIQVEKNPENISMIHNIIEWPFANPSKLEDLYLKYEEPYTLCSNLKYYDFPSVDKVLESFLKRKDVYNLIKSIRYLIDDYRFNKYITKELLDQTIGLLDEEAFSKYYEFEDNLSDLCKLLYYSLNKDYEPLLEEILKKIIVYGKTEEIHKHISLIKRFNLQGLLMFK